MITKFAEAYCSESPVMIEGYKEAVNDHTQVWRLYHKNEILTSLGEVSKAILNRLGLWLNRPASELAFMTKD